MAGPVLGGAARGGGAAARRLERRGAVGTLASACCERAASVGPGWPRTGGRGCILERGPAPPGQRRREAPGGCPALLARRECRRGFARRIEGYLQYYGMMKNQEGMLRDDARVEGYRAALEAAAPQLRGATVMDIGTGSGILAFLAAKYGARRVYAVEASPQMARVASRLARANGLVGVVQVLPKQVEDITAEEVGPGSVDVIVSELFSHFLVGELGLQAVTEAKRRFLRPGGLVLPATARLFLSPFEDRALGAELRARHSFWQERNFRGLGLDLSAAWPLAEEQALRQNVMDVVPAEALLVPPRESPWAELDLAGPSDPDHWRKIGFDVTFPRRSKDSVVDGLCGWWDVTFAGVADHGGAAPVLSTAPGAPHTVWVQCRFMLEQPLRAKAGDRLTARCDLVVNQAAESYVVRLELRNESSGAVSSAGPIELSNVYARHFAAAGVK